MSEKFGVDYFRQELESGNLSTVQQEWALENLARLGDPDGSIQLIEHLIENGNTVKAINILEADMMQPSWAQYAHGRMMIEGKHIEKDALRGWLKIKNAVKAGQLDAVKFMADHLAKAKPAPQEETNFARRSEPTSDLSQYIPADERNPAQDDHGIAQDLEQAEKLYRDLTQNGRPEEYVTLAAFLAHHDDIEGAQECIRHAANHAENDKDETTFRALKKYKDATSAQIKAAAKQTKKSIPLDAKTEKAITILSTIAESAFPEEFVTLARLYEGRDNISKAKEHIVNAVTAQSQKAIEALSEYRTELRYRVNDAEEIQLRASSFTQRAPAKDSFAFAALNHDTAVALLGDLRYYLNPSKQVFAEAKDEPEPTTQIGTDGHT